MLIELENATKTYGAVTALAGLSTALPEGAVGLLGPNGAGKTTMIRALLGLIALDDGRGRVMGMDILTEPLEIRRKAGFAPEDECLFPGLTGVRFVAYAGELVGMPPRDAIQRAHEVLDYVELGEARYRRVESYSTGMKQRLKIASAIVHDPKLLILDEPTNGMDPAGREEILELCRDLSRAKGMNLLISSHLLPDVEAVCEHIVVLGGGKVLAAGRLDELKRAHDRQYELRTRGDRGRFADLLTQRGATAEPVNDHLLVELPEGATVAMLWELADASAEQIRSLRPRRSTLEEVFLRSLALAEPN